MRRREFILLSAAAASVPGLACAQQGGTARIGVLMFTSEDDPQGKVRLSALQAGLENLGWANDRVRLDVRWTAGDPNRVRALAKELVSATPDVLLSSNTPTLAALRDETRSIPIVFTQVSDPVESGFVASLAQPGGNITGFQNSDVAMGGKWLEFSKAVAPKVTRAVFLHGPGMASNQAFVRAAEAVAAALGVEPVAQLVSRADEIGSGLKDVAERGNTSIVVLPHPVLINNRKQIIGLAASYTVPAVYPFRYFAAEGGLLAYGPDQIDQWRGAARYLDRILRGEKASELPVQAPTKFELAINLKTATAMGLDVSPSLLARADEVIE